MVLDSLGIKEKILERAEVITNISKNAELISDIIFLGHLVHKKWKNSLPYKPKLIFFGNGGSAADSVHITAEFINKFKIDRNAYPAIALTDNVSNITAIANDYEYSRIFEKQLDALARAGDIVFGISTSGKSKNVIYGLKKAKEKGAYTIGIGGKNIKKTKMSDYVDLLLVIPSNNTPIIQEGYMMLLHIFAEMIEDLMENPQPFAFVDRDNTIIEDVPYCHKIEDVKFKKDIFNYLKLLMDSGYLLTITTNQSGIGRGYFTLEDFIAVNSYIEEELLKRKIVIQGHFACPHKPEDNCNCRKPKTGLIESVMNTYNVDLYSSIVVGDREDIDGELALNLGIPYIDIEHFCVDLMQLI